MQSSLLASNLSLVQKLKQYLRTFSAKLCGTIMSFIKL